MALGYAQNKPSNFDPGVAVAVSSIPMWDRLTVAASNDHAASHNLGYKSALVSRAQRFFDGESSPLMTC